MLLWTAHKALIYRACAKALWIRGYKITDAEKYISRQNLEGHKLWGFFYRSCGRDENDPPFEKTHPYMVLRKALLDLSTTRNAVVHGARIEELGALVKANRIITTVINNSTKALGNAKVKTEAFGDKPLGDPLEDLRKWKRKSYVPKEKLGSL